jgi:hypothetical protein
MDQPKLNWRRRNLEGRIVLLLEGFHLVHSVILGQPLEYLNVVLMILDGFCEVRILFGSIVSKPRYDVQLDQFVNHLKHRILGLPS